MKLVQIPKHTVQPLLKRSYGRPLYQIAVFVLQVPTAPLHVVRDVQENRVFVFLPEEEEEEKT